MASQSIKDNNGALWVAIMAGQAGIWSVIWLKCTENARWPHVISDSASGLNFWMSKAIINENYYLRQGQVVEAVYKW